MSGYPNQPPQAFSYPQYYNAVPNQGQPGAYPGQPVGQIVFPGQPSVQPMYPGQPGYGQPVVQPVSGQPPQYPPRVGFDYPSVYPTINPTPTAPEFGYTPYPNTTPQPQPSYGSIVQWVPTTSKQAIGLSDRAVVAGYEGHDGSPLWVIRARFEGDIIPGKLAIKHHAAYVPWGGKENHVHDIEVCCAPPEKIKWVDSKNGDIPPNAIQAGNTSSGESLYVGRAKEQGSLTPGKVHPSHKAMYISFAGNEIPHKLYQIMCSA